MSAAIQIEDQPEQNRYVLRVDDLVVGWADYTRAGDHVAIPHTQIHPSYGGRGLGGRLVAFALDDIRGRGLKVVPACPFVADYVTRHPEYADLL